MGRADCRGTVLRSAGVVVTLVLGLGAATTEAAAQSWRIQGSWVAGQVGGAVLGAELRRPLGKAPPLPLPGVPGSGPVEMTSRAWHLTGMLGLGANAAPPPGSSGSIDPMFYLHGGVLYRTGRSVPGYVGLGAASYLVVGAVGPAVMVEAADVAAVQVGVLHGGGAWRGHAAIHVGLRFLRDVLGG